MVLVLNGKCARMLPWSDMVLKTMEGKWQALQPRHRAQGYSHSQHEKPEQGVGCILHRDVTSQIFPSRCGASTAFKRKEQNCGHMIGHKDQNHGLMTRHAPISVIVGGNKVELHRRTTATQINKARPSPPNFGKT